MEGIAKRVGMKTDCQSRTISEHYCLPATNVCYPLYPELGPEQPDIFLLDVPKPLSKGLQPAMHPTVPVTTQIVRIMSSRNTQKSIKHRLKSSLPSHHLQHKGQGVLHESLERLQPPGTDSSIDSSVISRKCSVHHLDNLESLLARGIGNQSL
jgi:hypothetical protein